MAGVLTGATWPAAATVGRQLGPRLQHVICVIVVASAIKTPLDVPLYWNAGLLLLGLFELAVVQSLQRIFLWMLALIALGSLFTLLQGNVAVSATRLAQLFLIVSSASLIARLDPDLLLRYLTLLLPVIILVTVVESLLPEPLFYARDVFGQRVARQGGLYGDPNYSAIMYGVIAVLLARRRPRVLALLPFLMAVPTLSRGVIIAVVAWLGTLMLRRWLVIVAVAMIVLLSLQPLLVLLIDALISDELRPALLRLSTERLSIWLAYAQMGLSHPLGVGYFAGPAAMADFAPQLPEWYAHSIFMQVFGEFGWLGYLVFLGFLSHLSVRVARMAPEELPVLVFLLTGYAFVNGLSDWAFWITIGYCLGRTRVPEAKRREAG